MRATGFIILCHGHLDRAGWLATRLAGADAAVVLHVDSAVSGAAFSALKAELAGFPNVGFVPRRRSVWGRFSITEATLDAVRDLLTAHPSLANICLLSGDTIPLQPVEAILDHLAKAAGHDLIETHPAGAGGWVKGGEAMDRFRFWHVFPWRERRRLFDLSVALQRRLGVRRKVPPGLEPRVGSQWWCLRTVTLRAILEDPRHETWRRFFRWCWIPDESFFQSLVPVFSAAIGSDLPVFSRFDPSGRPMVFYDDHAALLAGTGALFARKVWSGAEGLYRTFPQKSRTRGDGGKAFADAEQARFAPRSGLYSQGRHPLHAAEPGLTGGRRYDVVIGAAAHAGPICAALAGTDGLVVHGRLFARPARFADGQADQPGGLRDDMDIRFDLPGGFLRNLLSCGGHQVFFLEPEQCRAAVEVVARDPAAHLHVLSALQPASLPVVGAFSEAMTMQHVVNLLSLPLCKARVRFHHPAEASAAAIAERIADDILTAMKGHAA